MKIWLLAMITSLTLGHSTHVALADDAPKPVERSSGRLQDGARFVPAVGGSPRRLIGIKVYAIRDGSRAARSGLHNGDTIVAVDGVAATTPDGTMVQARTRELLALVTEGKPHTLEVKRKDAVVALTVPER
ncbi:MAG: PDZ domain-containing protein [Kofleriaceae bacterium]